LLPKTPKPHKINNLNVLQKAEPASCKESISEQHD